MVNKKRKASAFLCVIQLGLHFVLIIRSWQMSLA